MNELLTEIQEDIRNERIQRLWSEGGKLLVGVSVAVVLATAASVVWKNHREKVAMEQTTIFIKGTDRLAVEDYKGALEAFSELTGDANSPYYGMAMLRKAQLQNLEGEHDKAVATYEELAKNGTGPNNEAFATLARLLVASESKDVIETSPTAPLYYLASERKAWQLVEQGKKDEAGQIFLSLLKDNDAPLTLRRRSAEALQYLAPEKLVQMHDEK